MYRINLNMYYLLQKITTKKKRYRGAHAHHSGFTHCVLHLCCAQGVVTWPLAEHPMILMDPIHPASKFSQRQVSGAWCLSPFRVSEYLPFGLLLFPSSALPAGLYCCCTVVISVTCVGSGEYCVIRATSDGVSTMRYRGRILNLKVEND